MPAGAWLWSAVFLTCVLALGSAWILFTSDWDPTDTASVAQKIRTILVFGLATLAIVLLLVYSLTQGEPPAPVAETPASPWWTDPLGATTPDAVFTLDNQMLIRSVSTGAERMFGYSARELAGQSLFRLIPAKTRFSAAELLADTHNRKGVVLNVKGLSRDGTERLLELRLTRFERGSHVMYLAVCRARLAPPRRQAKKEPLDVDWTSRFMNYIGQEIDGAATSIFGHTDIVLNTLASNDPHRENVDEIRASGEHLSRLSKILDIVSRTPASLGKEVDIHEWLRATIADGAESPPEIHDVVLQLEAADSIVRVETSYLWIVLVRLLKRTEKEGASCSEIVIRTANPPEATGGRLSMEITRPAPVPDFDQLTYELARGIVGKTGCSLNASQTPDGAVCFSLSIPTARKR